MQRTDVNSAVDSESNGVVGGFSWLEGAMSPSVVGFGLAGFTSSSIVACRLFAVSLLSHLVVGIYLYLRFFVTARLSRCSVVKLVFCCLCCVVYYLWLAQL